MAVLVTLDTLRNYARGLDERLNNKTKYPDTWIDSKINTGYELVSSKRQPFLNEEVLDLTQYIIDGTAKFEVEMDMDVGGWKQVFPTSANPEAIHWTTKPDNKTVVNLDINSLKPQDENLLTFQYYYFPSTTTGDQYFSTDIYHMVRHGIASAIYDALHDYEKRDDFDRQLEMGARSAVNGLDYDAFNVVGNNFGSLGI